MILEYTSVRLLLQSAVSTSRIFIYGKNSDGCDNVTMSRDDICTHRARFLVVQ